MHVKGVSSDVLRISVSSAPSTSSHGSGQDDSDTLGDIYIWGEVICDSGAKPGADRDTNPSSTRTDVLSPKLLECNVALDAQHVACGVRHAALVTKNGEVFTWGEESGGRLGHGVSGDAVYPRLVDSLAAASVDFVACGEFHTCAVTTTGELYTWGDGTHNIGLLGHGTSVSHWIPRRVAGSLDYLRVTCVTCGIWHTALITTTRQLYTFGDGTFGVLGHGDRESCTYPREVEALSGQKTLAVACGAWHTAAIVEFRVTHSNVGVQSGKLFTWGDGDRYRLGHGDKEARLKPTCVSSLKEHNFHKLACGHSLTVGLTTSGNVFTMGSTVYGQLGNPYSDGKSPCLVEDKLGEIVTGVACGSYHVAVMTSRNEVYTWGKGANGRLGHGDMEDRKTPTFVEALKDRIVKQIACGSNFTAAICHHKWVSGNEQTHCSACRQTFGFTRKRHNCYNCGLVHCHSCSSRKTLGAALSPNPNKQYRVCDTCYAKINRMLESACTNAKRTIMPYPSSETEDKIDVTEAKLSKSTSPNNLDLIKYLDTKATNQRRADLHRTFFKTENAPVSHSVTGSRAVSPFSRKISPLRSATPVPTMSGLSFSKSIVDSLKKTNELLTQEVLDLRSQVDTLKHCCEQQELELQKSAKTTREAMKLAAEEIAKSNAAKEIIKKLTAQLKEVAQKLPPEIYEGDCIRSICMLKSTETHLSHRPAGVQLQRNERNSSHISTKRDSNVQDQRVADSSGEKHLDTVHRKHHGTTVTSSRAIDVENREQLDFQNIDGSPPASTSQEEAEWIEQYEPGVYITLTALPDGIRALKRVRFSRRRFAEHQAETWWSDHREKVYEKYNVRVFDRRSSASTSHSTLSARQPDEEMLSSPHELE